VNDDGTDWLSPAGGGDFDASVLVVDVEMTPSLDDVMAIPITDMRGGQRAELNLRCFRLPEHAIVAGTSRRWQRIPYFLHLRALRP